MRRRREDRVRRRREAMEAVWYVTVLGAMEKSIARFEKVPAQAENKAKFIRVPAVNRQMKGSFTCSGHVGPSTVGLQVDKSRRFIVRVELPKNRETNRTVRPTVACTS